VYDRAGKLKLKANFLASAHSLDQCPRWPRTEVAIAGRSNVGKSSLLNALTGVKNLARVSATPGRTRTLNFFELGGNLILVDLPGYGFAAMSHTEAAKVADLLHDYLTSRSSLAALVLLIDSRRGPQADEITLAGSATSRGAELIVVATKCDKLRSSDRAALPKLFAPIGQNPIMCSVRDGEGIVELRKALARCAAPNRDHDPDRSALV